MSIILILIESGEKIEIRRRNRPIAKIVPIAPISHFSGAKLSSVKEDIKF